MIMPESHVLLPTPDNKNRWMVLLDSIPNLGELSGFFHVAGNKRTINGFTSSDILFVLRFMSDVERDIRAITARGLQGGLGFARTAIVVIDRMDGGLMLTHSSLPYLASSAIQERMALKAPRGWNYDARRRAATMAFHLAKMEVNNIPTKFRPSTTFLRGENPITVLRQNNVHWWLGSSSKLGDTAPDVNYYSPRLAAYRDLMNDRSTSPALRLAADEIDGLVNDSLTRMGRVRIEEVLKQSTNSNDQPQPFYSVAQLIGLKALLDQRLQGILEQNVVNTLIAKIFSHRINFALPAELDGFVLAFLRVRLRDEQAHKKIISNGPRINMGTAGNGGNRTSYQLWKTQRLGFAQNIVRQVDYPSTMPIAIGGGSQGARPL